MIMADAGAAAAEVNGNARGSAAMPGERVMYSVPPTSRLTSNELPRLHQELGLWMAHTRYQLQAADRTPIWRVQNTSMTISAGAGIGAYFAVKRFRPSVKFPFDTIVPFVCFYLTHRAAQVWQMPGLYDSFLFTGSPLGERAREILQALRKGGKLPSQEFGSKLPPPRAAPRASTGAAAGGAGGADGGADGGGGGFGFGFGAEASAADEPVSTPRAAAVLEEPAGFAVPGGAPGFRGIPAPPADPWSDAGVGNALEGTDAWGTGQHGANTQLARKTWDEIRADAAKRAQSS